MHHIDRRGLLRSAAALAGAGLLAHKTHAADAVHTHAANPTAAIMVETADRFLAALEPDQRAKARFEYGADERLNWHFIPKERKGLPLREMKPYQKPLAFALLSAGLSQNGAIKAFSIMSLEEVLRLKENDNGEKRNPEKYYFSVFGTPSMTDVWGYRVEGHHVSQNYSISNGQVVDGPSFFGANPAEVRQGPRKGLRTLAAEDDLGFDMIQALDVPQRQIAILDPKAPTDIVTAASRQAAIAGQPSGLHAAKLNGKQFDVLTALVENYARLVPGDLAERRRDQLRKAGKDIFFAWCGGITQGDARYYRVQTSSFLIEFDDTQDEANHIHSVWRDLNGDFGHDLLKAHYAAGHAETHSV